MKTKRGIRTIAMVLIITFAVSFLTFGVSAQDNANWSQKISDELLEAMSTADSKEKIPVWVWFTDIDQDEVEEQVKAETGLSEEDLDVAFKAADDKLIYEINSISDGDNQNQDLSEKMDAYLSETQNERQEEKERTDKYIKARRDIARDMYVENNEENINELKLPQDEIIFQSELTSSVIINLTKSQINRVAKSKVVISIDLHIDEEPISPLCENQKSTMRADFAAKQFGLTGEGVNVLVHDHGCVRTDADEFNNISNSDNIKVVVDEKLYSVSNTSIMPGSHKNDHPNLISGTMQAFAPDVNIYSVGYKCYEDVEWAIINCDIDLINGSINYGTVTNYSDDAKAKWFDALVSTHNVALVASAGNDYYWQKSGWPNVISPASGYNCISAGAYITSGNSNGDVMRDYRYNPTDSTEQVNYKPDMVVAAGSTSEASPSFSGIIAMMIQLKPSLKVEPELIKAILMASCHRKVKACSGTPQEYMSDGLTQRQGAGAIDAYRAISIVLKGNYGTRDISTGSKDINIEEKANNSNINVSLAWLRKNSYDQNSVSEIKSSVGTLQELELSVLSGSKFLGESKKTNTGKQMVYFPAVASDDYTIRVTKASENTEAVKFAYAWSSEDISVKNIKLTAANSDGTITKEEVRSQLSANKIELGDDKEKFTVSFDSSVKNIGDSALSELTNMRTVNINEGIVDISASAFKNCSGLTSVTIPKSVKNIGSNAFYGCTYLSEVYFHGMEAPTINANAFKNIAKDPEGTSKVYAKGYLERYTKGYAEAYDDLTIVQNSDVRTIYFENKQNWEEVRAYLWDYCSDRRGEWPGIEMKKEYKSSDGYDVYSITIDYNEYDMLIINDGSNGNQTINLGAGLDGVVYYVPESTNDKYFLFNSNRYYK